MEKSESINELAKALSSFQGEVRNIKKDSTNPFFKMHYASLSAVWDAIRESLSKNGLSVIQLATDEISDDGRFILETTVTHSSGQWISGYLPIKPVKDDPQGLGSAYTYARRYSLCSLLGLVADEDDDGSVATQPAKPKKEAPKEPKEEKTEINKPSSELQEFLKWVSSHGKTYTPSWACGVLGFKAPVEIKDFDKAKKELMQIAGWEK